MGKCISTGYEQSLQQTPNDEHDTGRMGKRISTCAPVQLR